MRFALDIAQTPARHVVYIEDTPVVRADRGRLGETKHFAHGFQFHVRATGFVRIAQ